MCCTQKCDTLEYLHSEFNENFQNFVHSIEPDSVAKYLRIWEYAYTFYAGDFSKTDVVLDVGSLFSMFPVFLSKYVGSICLSDSYGWSELADQSVVDAWAAMVAKEAPTATIKYADIMELPFEDNTFDKITCVSVIEHVQDDRKALKELIRVLKPGGRLIITTDYHPTISIPLTSRTGFRLYNHDTLMKLLDETILYFPINETDVVLRFPPNFKFASVGFVITKG